MTRSTTRALGALLVISGCSPTTDVTLTFEGLVGGAPARCGQTYAGLGTSSTELELSDFRLYVHDVRLVTADGRERPVTLSADGLWQQPSVALLDFEDGTAGCENGTPETNATLRGTVEDPGPFTGLRMRVGVPFELNHGDASTAAAPLNRIAMFWSWNAGYKFLRVDGRTTGLPAGWRLHLGSTGCEGDGRGNVSGCTFDNRPEVTLDGGDPTARPIRIDLAEILGASNLDEDLGGQPGCMSGVDDMDCLPIFHALGLPFAGAPAPGPQRLFRLE
ncbi:MAG: metallo-mystery pair system four-Cys motif protein [Sandaracinaceae bacterium]|nr:metallo-mystery pair system four-Cys motif protein [Sandaracinaceae bacterium]